jgi:CBS domain-containing protein
MEIRECMTREVKMCEPGDSIRQAAMCMAECDAGVIPVADGDKLVGMITDRDIAIRAVARGLDPETEVREVMSRDVKYCFEDESVEDVLRNMGDNQLRRLPVLSRDKRLVGIVSLSDLADDSEEIAGETLSQIAEPTGRHTQRLQ